MHGSEPAAPNRGTGCNYVCGGVNVNILAWLLTGLIAGLIAKALMPGNDPGGLIVTILLGIAGAIVGGFLAVGLGFSNGIDDFDIGTIFLAVVGAMLLLFAYRLINTNRGVHI
jgi:uncharacterized membrane protein YeaQ/YmgE (transglycosylase-associated protein family)